MTSLYLDTNIGCTLEVKQAWTREDEGKVSFLSLLKKFFA